MDRAELQLRLIRAVFRGEGARQEGSELDDLRARCEYLLYRTAPRVDGDARLRDLLTRIRAEIRG